MLNFEKLKRRALLTETLPYEVPTIFSNEFLFSSELTIETLSDHHRKIIAESDYRLPLKTDKYTIPLNFQIRKGASSRNTLSVIHPLQQINIADFLDDYASTIIEECKSSQASLRAPAEIVPFLSKAESEKFHKNQVEFESNAPSDGLITVPYAPSYFTLKKYNLLDRFYSSNELLRLETRFRLLRTVDVTKCFFNIYTHSITWAVKEKSFSKKHSAKYSFEGRFDELMQKSNYNETNGIVVGPEISRVFAEVIFQKIDQNVIESLYKSHELIFEDDYTFRRYVDDYFLFARDEGTLDRLTRTVHDCLEEYKLFPNHAKQNDFKRPFITNITLAKRGIVEIATRLEKLCSKELSLSPDLEQNKKESDSLKKSLRSTSREFREILEDLRVMIGKTGSSFSEVSGPIYTAITSSIHAISLVCPKDSEEFSSDISIRLRGVLRILFYCIASDFRVPPIFKCQQVIERSRNISARTGAVNAEVIDALIIFELKELFDTYSKDESVDNMPIELCNLMLIAATVNADLFLKQETVKDFFEQAVTKDKFSYFSFLSILFILKNDPGDLKDVKDHVIKRTKSLVIENKSDLRIVTEIYLLFSDFISCPYINDKIKCNTMNAVIGTKSITISEADVAKIAPHFAFIDWGGSKASYILRRKRLQPVYFSW